MNRKQLLASPEYWFEQAQNDLYREVVKYQQSNNLNQTELADKLGVTKGYVSQILKGEYNYTLKKLIEIALAINLVPEIVYKNLSNLQSKKRSRQQRTIESFMMVNGGAGDIFYSSKEDKDITAIATHYKRKIKTERVFVLSTSNSPTAERLTKVTML